MLGSVIPRRDSAIPDRDQRFLKGISDSSKRVAKTPSQAWPAPEWSGLNAQREIAVTRTEFKQRRRRKLGFRAHDSRWFVALGRIQRCALAAIEWAPPTTMELTDTLIRDCPDDANPTV